MASKFADPNWNLDEFNPILVNQDNRDRRKLRVALISKVQRLFNSFGVPAFIAIPDTGLNREILGTSLIYPPHTRLAALIESAWAKPFLDQLDYEMRTTQAQAIDMKLAKDDVSVSC